MKILNLGERRKIKNVAKLTEGLNLIKAEMIVLEKIDSV